MDKQKIAMNLLNLRGGTPRERVAVDLGISYSAISAYESGQRIPRDDVKIKLANYYGESVQNIFFS